VYVLALDPLVLPEAKSHPETVIELGTTFTAYAASGGLLVTTPNTAVVKDIANSIDVSVPPVGWDTSLATFQLIMKLLLNVNL